MAIVSTYLNFARETEAAFHFYKSVFGTEFNGPVQRFSDVPPQEGMPPMPDEIKNLVMHIELPIAGGHKLMGTDSPPEMGFTVHKGNNTHIMIETDTREEAARYFHALAEEGTVTMELQDMFWGAYYGSCTDQFGVQWMFNCSAK